MQNDIFSDYRCDDDLWGRNLFEDLNLDEVKTLLKTTCHITKYLTTEKIFTKFKMCRYVCPKIALTKIQLMSISMLAAFHSVIHTSSTTVMQTDKSDRQTEEEEREICEDTTSSTYSICSSFLYCYSPAYRTTNKKRRNEITRVAVKCSKFGNHGTAYVENEL